MIDSNFQYERKDYTALESAQSNCKVVPFRENLALEVL